MSVQCPVSVNALLRLIPVIDNDGFPATSLEPMLARTPDALFFASFGNQPVITTGPCGVLNMLVLALLLLIFSALAAYGFTYMIILVARGSAHTWLTSPVSHDRTLVARRNSSSTSQ